MSNTDSIITHQELESYGEEFGVKRHEVTVSRIDGDHNKAPFKGTFSRRDLSLGCGMMANDLVALRSERVQSTVTGQFIVRLPFQVGEVRVGSTELKTVLLRPQSALLVAMTSDIQLDGKFVSGNRYTDFFVHVAPGGLVDEELSDRIHAKTVRNVVEQFPVEADLCARALRISEAETDDCVQGLLAESCALELLACSIAACADAEPSATAISTRDTKKMSMIRDRLVAEPDGDHRLIDLARDAGISVTSLKTKFSAVFGQSVASFLRDTRLERARDGILKDGWTVSQAAYLVGYKHQSSFSAAFHRKFGVWPSELLRM